MKQLRKDGWIYWFAYSWMEEKDRPPGHTNLCKLFWLSLIGALIIWPLIGILWVGLGFVCGFLFSCRPTVCKGDKSPAQEGGTLWTEYKNWPKTPKGNRIWPFFVLIAVGSLYFIGLLAYGLHGLYNFLLFGMFAIFLAFCVCFVLYEQINKLSEKLFPTVDVDMNSIVYRIAFSLEKNKPERIDKLSLWFSVWIACVMWPCIAFFWLIGNLIGFFFTHQYLVFNASDDNFVPYKRWPKFYGRNVWPLSVIAILGIAATLIALVVFYPISFGIVVLVLFAVIGIIFLCANSLRGESWELFKDWTKAKKERVCPRFEIIE